VGILFAAFKGNKSVPLDRQKPSSWVRRAMRRKPQAQKYWISKVKTVSTFPPKGTFTKDADSIARIMASKKVSPRGIGSGIRMIQYFINRAGKGLSTTRKKELQKAKRILQQKRERQMKR
jgi:Protein of unknown function (DUF3175)